jgi:hypothetical protein
MNMVFVENHLELYRSFLVEEAVSPPSSAIVSLIQRFDLIQTEERAEQSYRIAAVVFLFLPIVGWIIGYCLMREAEAVEERVARFRKAVTDKEPLHLDPALVSKVKSAFLYSKEMVGQDLAQVQAGESHFRNLREIRSDLLAIRLSERRKTTLLLVSIVVLAFLPILGWIACYLLSHQHYALLDKIKEFEKRVHLSGYSAETRFGFVLGCRRGDIPFSMRAKLEEILDAFGKKYSFPLEIPLQPFIPLPAMHPQFIQSQPYDLAVQKACEEFRSRIGKLEEAFIKEGIPLEWLRSMEGVFTQIARVGGRNIMLTIQKKQSCALIVKGSHDHPPTSITLANEMYIESDRRMERFSEDEVSHQYCRLDCNQTFENFGPRKADRPNELYVSPALTAAAWVCNTSSRFVKVTHLPPGRALVEAEADKQRLVIPL